jgi:hypothetical protein
MLIPRPCWPRQVLLFDRFVSGRSRFIATLVALPVCSALLVAPTHVGAQTACPTISSSSPVIITGAVTQTPCTISATGGDVTFSNSTLSSTTGLFRNTLNLSGTKNKINIEYSQINRGSVGAGMSVTANENVINIQNTIINNTVGGSAVPLPVAGNRNILRFIEATLDWAPSTQAALTITGDSNVIDYGSGSSFGAQEGGGIIISGEKNALSIESGSALAPVRSAVVIYAPSLNTFSDPNVVTNAGTIGRAGRLETIETVLGSPTLKSFVLNNTGTIINQIRQIRLTQNNQTVPGSGGLLSPLKFRTAPPGLSAR